MKGRIAWVFWLVVVLAVLTSTASYAWLAMNLTATARVLEVEAVSDSLFLQVSADAESGYGEKISFGTQGSATDENENEVFLVSYNKVPDLGALLLYSTQITEVTAKSYGTSDGKYNGGSRRFYIRTDSVIGDGKENFYDITDTLIVGQSSLVGYYAINESSLHYKTSSVNNRNYYVSSVRSNGCVDYSCIGKFEIGEQIAGRAYWGYAMSNNENEVQPDNAMNVVSLDFPIVPYCLKNTIYLKGAVGSSNYNNLRVSSVKIGGIRNYLTNAIRILFVATDDDGRQVIKSYNHRNPSQFDGMLFSEMLGDGQQIVTVDIYIYFDGKDESAHNSAEYLTTQSVSVTFTVDDHDYN